MDSLFVGMKLTGADHKHALVLHYAGYNVYDIYNVLYNIAETTFDATKKLLTYFSDI